MMFYSCILRGIWCLISVLHINLCVCVFFLTLPYMNKSHVYYLDIHTYMKGVGKTCAIWLKTKNGENGGWSEIKKNRKFFFGNIIFFYGIWCKNVSNRDMNVKISRKKNRLFMLWNPRNRPLIWLVYKHTPGVFFFENICSFFELVSGGHQRRTRGCLWSWLLIVTVWLVFCSYFIIIAAVLFLYM